MTFDKHQGEIGWVCPECKLARGADRRDPCLGTLPGVSFACCGHGGRSHGYIAFENGFVLRWGGHPIRVEDARGKPRAGFEREREG